MYNASTYYYVFVIPEGVRLRDRLDYPYYCIETLNRRIINVELFRILEISNEVSFIFNLYVSVNTLICYGFFRMKPATVL